MSDEHVTRTDGTIASIGNHLARRGWRWLCDRYELFDQVKITGFIETKLGHVGGTSQGTVAIQKQRVADAEHMSPEEARSLAQALMRAASLAERWGRQIAGHYVVRVFRGDGFVRVSHCGEEHTMRLVHGRRLRQCTSCRGMHTNLWTAINPPDRRPYDPNPAQHFARVCEACVEKLANEPSGLRGVKL